MPDAGPVLCDSSEECDDGTFCNGVEACVDGMCSAGTAPCPAMCDEITHECIGDCPDADGDGARDADCGGDDCDDSDPDRYPGNTEVCDGDDEDCDDATFGDRDVDRDGYVSAECCNGTNCGTDCADGIAAVHPTSVEACNLRDDDCDGDVDEGVVVSLFVDEDSDLHGDPGMAIMTCADAAHTSGSTLDCDDANPHRHGALVEVCDGEDNDCDEEVDEGSTLHTWYVDMDGDGFGDPTGDVVVQCAEATGYSLLPLDCDDADPSRSPRGPELCNGRDDDCDGVASFMIAPGDTEDDDRDGYADAACGGDDCDDQDEHVYPGAPELDDGVDNNCDGLVDNDVEEVTWFLDMDGDGAGDDSESMSSAERQPGYVLVGGDCDDGDATSHPNGLERCVGVDNDCDGETDESALGAVRVYVDGDGDGFGDATQEMLACLGDVPTGYSVQPGDCDDAEDTAYPGAPELCDVIDNDCDTTVDEGSAPTWWQDGDGDGFGNPAGMTRVSCEMPTPGAWVTNADDCSDGNPAINPDTNWYIDGDGDGYAADAATAVTQCEQPTAMHVTERGDCDDSLASTNPGVAADTCNGVDDDCSGTIDDGADAGRCAANPDSTGICLAPPAPALECACVDSNFGDCDGAPGNGCEVDVRTTAAHCGACGAACEPDEGCVAGTCEPAGILSLTDAEYTSCALREYGVVQCWGAGQYIFETGADRRTPETLGWPYQWVDFSAVAISAGRVHSCGIVGPAGSRDILCWGRNPSGQLGVGNTTPSIPPIRIAASVDDVVNDWSEVQTCDSRTFARTASGTIYSWGADTHQSLGRTWMGTENYTPGQVDLIDDATQLHCDSYHACALRASGEVWCWGGDSFEALGNGTVGGGPTPRPVLVDDGGSGTPLADALEVTTAERGGCARLMDGTMHCWGSISVFSYQEFAFPIAGISNATSIDCGDLHCCAVVAAGGVKCFGNGSSGRLGNGDMMNSATPVDVVDTTNVPIFGAVEVMSGRAHSCARFADDRVMCWGLNSDGQLGDDTITARTRAVPVMF